MDPLLPTPALAERLVAAERDCIADWLRAVEALPSNPFKIALATFGSATALACGAVPAQVFNRVFGMTPADHEHVPAILEFYRALGAEPTFDLSPYAVPPYWETAALQTALTRHGLTQGAFHQMLYGRPAQVALELPAGVTVREVGPEEAATFGQVYEQVWGDSGVITPLLGQPMFRCYLAWVDGEPAALGVLHIANGAASMANALTAPQWRGRGCQSALLARRIHDAALAGCDLLVSQCRPGSSSQNNQLRAGFQIAGSKAWWVPLPSGAAR